MPSFDGPILDAVGLQRTFGALRVLRGVDLRVRAGEALVVVGPNGAGKTTLLRLLAGLARPSAGEVRVLGQRVAPSAPDARRPVGFVSHQSMLYDDLTVRENVVLAARLYGIADAGGAARRALDALGLAGWGEERPPHLSRGLLQRASIARALAHAPRLLLLDEPFTGLDAPSADRLRTLLAERLAAGLALVLVTHYLEEAWPLASRVAVLAGGRWALEEPRPADLAQFLLRYRALADA